MQATEIELTEPQRIVLEAFAGGGVELSPEPSAREVFKELRELGLLKVHSIFTTFDKDKGEATFHGAFRRTALGLKVWRQIQKKGA